VTGSYLSDEAIKSALDALWTKTLRPYDLPWEDRHGHIPSPRSGEGALIYPGSLDPIPLGVPELDWTVQAGGWKLVIEDGAIRGLIET